MSVLAQDYLSANANYVGYANPSSLAKRDAHGFLFWCSENMGLTQERRISFYGKDRVKTADC